METLSAWGLALALMALCAFIFNSMLLGQLSKRIDVLTLRGDAMAERLDNTTSLRYSVAARKELQEFRDTTRQQIKVLQDAQRA
jgi:hypothetical protein